ncbi:hypothetical protein ABN034_09340 [Actinopolymorpha sp. B11F2]|uniref:hypothetical protein n=1 Tax=Actinopolymorpha sp. B11F2 TaxID=3160862 RepID=UPI0032E47E84
MTTTDRSYDFPPAVGDDLRDCPTCTRGRHEIVANDDPECAAPFLIRAWHAADCPALDDGDQGDT